MLKTSLLTLMLLLLSTGGRAQEFLYATNYGKITITKYLDLGYGGVLTVPDEIDNLPVTGIGPWAFYLSSLLAVTIPDSLIHIGEGAFAGSQQLFDVRLGANLTTIGERAFVGTRLSSITIPRTVTAIGAYAFDSCPTLTRITVDELNASYRSVDGVLFDKSQTQLIDYPEGKNGDYIIPHVVSSIGDYAFQGCASLTGIVIPGSVTNIGQVAFNGCTRLPSISLVSNITRIRPFVFADCNSLTNVVIPDSITSIEEYAFYDCTALTSISIPNSVWYIGEFAFSDCTNLTTAMIPAGVTWVQRGVFENTRLSTIILPSSVRAISGGAFMDCRSLNGVYFQGNAPISEGDPFLRSPTTVYYLPGTTGWSATFGGRPTSPWFLPNPLILSTSRFGPQPSGFGFTISWATNAQVVVEAITGLANPIWSALATNVLVEGSAYFVDPEWAEHRDRFYRLRSM